MHDIEALEAGPQVREGTAVVERRDFAAQVRQQRDLVAGLTRLRDQVIAFASDKDDFVVLGVERERTAQRHPAGAGHEPGDDLRHPQSARHAVTSSISWCFEQFAQRCPRAVSEVHPQARQPGAEFLRDLLDGGMAAAKTGTERQRRREWPVTAQLPGHVGAGLQVPRCQRGIAPGHPGLGAAGQHDEQVGHHPVSAARPGCLPSAIGHASSLAGVRLGGQPQRLNQAPGVLPVAHANVVAGGYGPAEQLTMDQRGLADTPGPGQQHRPARCSGEGADGGVQRRPVALLAPPQRGVLQQDGPQQQSSPGAQHRRHRSPAGQKAASGQSPRESARPRSPAGPGRTNTRS